MISSLRFWSLVIVLMIFFPSCGSKNPGYYKRVNGHKVWFPDRDKKLHRRYERCPF